MQVISIDGKNYIGEISEKDNQLYLEDAVAFNGDLDKESLTLYICLKNINETEYIKLSKYSQFSSRELKKEENDIYMLLKTYFEEAKKDCIKYLENKVFKQLVKERS